MCTYVCTRMIEKERVLAWIIVEKRRYWTVDLAKGQKFDINYDVLHVSPVKVLRARSSALLNPNPRYCACAGARARTSPFQPSFLAHSLIYGPLLRNLLITRRAKSDRQNKLKFLGNVAFRSEKMNWYWQLYCVQLRAWKVFVRTA